MDSRTTLQLSIALAAVLSLWTPAIAGDSLGEVRGPPPDGPAHGVSDTTFHRLWSGDEDGRSNGSAVEGSPDDVPAARLATVTDYVFEHPPAAVPQWNRGDLEDYPESNQTTSVYPEGIHLHDGRFIADAFATIYAVDPSTLLHRHNRTVHYAAPDGTVRGVVDYRVALPENDTEGPRRVEWTRAGSTINWTRFTIDGTVREEINGTERPTFEYDGLSGEQTLTVNVAIVAQVTKRVRRCTDWNESGERCRGRWRTSREQVFDTANLEASRTVQVYRQPADGARVRTPAGDTRTTVATSVPWAAVRLGDTTVRSPWRFYTAGTPGWGTLTTTTANGTRSEPSPARPLQVHAVPVDTAASIAGRAPEGSGPTVHTNGARRPGVELPSRIDVPTAPSYRRAGRITVRGFDGGATGQATLVGLVVGTNRTLSLDEPRTLRPTALDVTVRPGTDGRTFVTTRVRTSGGEPVTNGTLWIEGVPVPVTGEQTTIPVEPRGAINVTYEPVAWWNTSTPQQAATVRVLPPARFPVPERVIETVVALALVLVPVGLVVYGLHRTTGGGLFGGR